MRKGYCLALAALLFTIYNPEAISQASEFQYPYYLIDSFHSSSDCWIGIDSNGYFPSIVDPRKYLVGPPPSVADSAVTLPIDSWVELLFRGVIVDGPGDDLFVSEMDPVGEHALVFLTDGDEHEYLLGVAEVPDSTGHLPTIVGFDIAGRVIPFEPRAVRVVGIDLRGGSPGFDLSYVSARIAQDTDEAAAYPYPPDKAEDVPIDTVLSWMPRHFGDRYIVHFGEDISDVYPDSDPVLSPEQPQEANFFDPNTLELGKTYHWRIDQVNQADPNHSLRGAPWSFTVEDYSVLDDFESYRQGSTLDNFWILEQGSTWSHIGLSKAPDPIHGCQQAMTINYYYDDEREAVVSHIFESAQDWKAKGVKSIELFFRGVEYNNTDAILYVALGDGSVEAKIPYEGDMNDIAGETWKPWRVPLNLTSEDIDFTHIESLSIGIQRDPNLPGFSTYGTLYIDDIRLYPARCIEDDRPQGDLNGDCIVDFDDYTELAYNWLESGYNIYQVQEPNADPVFWYEFENNVVDTIGNAHGDVQESRQYDTGVVGKAIKFNGNQAVNVFPVSHIFSQIEKGLTIAFWQKGNDSTHKRDTMFCSEYIYNSLDPAISINLGCWDGSGIYNFDCGSSLSLDKRLTGKHRYKKEWEGQWNHWAFTKDLRTGVMQVFLNGRLINNQASTSTYLPVINSFSIGSGWYGGYDGLMDDLRIYDYALSQPEVAYIATNGTGIFDLKLFSNADLDNDNIIDYNDLALLAESWLESRVFPGE